MSLIVPEEPGPLARRDTSSPAALSARRMLRSSLPEMYHSSSVTMAFLQGFEEVADPIGVILDSLPALFHPDHAPPEVLTVLASWFGVDEVEAQPEELRRETLLRAGELSQLRGTRAGLELVLSLFFRDIPIRIVDRGKVIVSEEPVAAPPSKLPAFDVFVDEPIPEDRQLALAQCIERWKPVTARFRLKVKREWA